MVIQKIISAMVLFFSIQSLSAQEIDKSLYQKTTLNYLRHSSGTPKAIEYYKFDVVFVGRRPGAGIEFFGFIELNDQLDDAVSEFKGPNTLPEIKPGQFVTVYFREFPVSSSFALPEYLIDHIEIPAEVFSFTATHKIIEKTNVMFPPGDGARLMIPVDSGVEVQVLGREFHISKIEDGKGDILIGYWMWLVTGKGYGGWTFSSYLEPLPHAANIEIPTDFLFEPTHKAIKEATVWRYPGREARTTVDSGVEVMVYHTAPDVVSSEGETGRCLYLVTGNGYLGYAFASHFEPLQQTAAAGAEAAEAASVPSVVAGEPAPEAEQSSGFPLPRAIAGLGAVLLGVIFALIAAKRKKKFRD